MRNKHPKKRCRIRCRLCMTPVYNPYHPRRGKIVNAYLTRVGKKTQPPAKAEGYIDYPQGDSNPCLQDENLIS